MLAVVFVIGLLASHATAETIQCTQGQQACSGHSQLSIINNQVSCCRDEFSMHWTSDQLTGMPACYCNRMYFETDCLQGQTECQNATSITGDGRCCVNSDSMSVISNAFINGVRVDSCKCRRYNTIIGQNGVARVMTPAEEARFRAEMSQWSQNFRQQMGTMAQNLRTSLGSLGNIVGTRMTPVVHRTGLEQIGQWTTSFIDGLSNSFRPVVPPNPRNVAPPAPAPSPATGVATPNQTGGATPTQAPNITQARAAAAARAAITARNQAEIFRRNQAEIAARNQARAQQDQAAMMALFGMNAERME